MIRISLFVWKVKKYWCFWFGRRSEGRKLRRCYWLWRWVRRQDSGDGSQGKAEFVNLVCKERSKAVCERRRWSRER